MELTGIASLLRGLGVLYWLIAAACVGLALHLPSDRRRKIVWSVTAVAAFGFFPAIDWYQQHQRAAFAAEAWAYFKRLCAEKAGEQIYKKFSGVRSVLVVKPLPPAAERDLYDQHWLGDPYSNATPTDQRGKGIATALTLNSRGPLGPQRGLDFVEMRDGLGENAKFIRIWQPLSNNQSARIESIDRPVSRLGIAWEDVSTPQDRKYWVAQSRLAVFDLTDNNRLVAERIGVLIEPGFGSTGGQRRPWLAGRGPKSTCPPVSHGDGYSDSWFLSKLFD